jgi:hypothetical protein
MSTKFFYFDGGVAKAIEGATYKAGAPVEFQLRDAPVLAIQGWQGIAQGQRAAIIATLYAAGWTEGLQSKPDEDE